MSVRFERGIGRWVAIILVALASCTGDLPNTAWRGGPGERGYSAGTSATPIADLIREHGIRTPDQTAGVPFLEQVRRELAKTDPASSFAGATYDLTVGNRLAPGWLLQSPTHWGRRAADLPLYPLDCKDCEPDVLLPPCRSDADCRNGGTCRAIWPARSAPSVRRNVCFGHSEALLLPVHDLVAGARFSVDIAALQPLPDTRFLAALRAGLEALADSGRPVTVRLMVGQYPPDGADAAALLSSLTAGLRDTPGARLTLDVAVMRSCTSFEACRSFSWPHAKFIAIDGEQVLVGGHNFWSEDYFVDKPVHDLSLRAAGPAAASASRFADRLWRFVCANLDRKPAVQLARFAGAASASSAACPSSLLPSAIFAGGLTGGTPMLAVGRLGAGITKDFANHSDLARDLVFGAARHTIRMSQQDIGFMFGRSDALFPDSTLDRLIDFMEQRDGHVYIVLSNRGAAGNSGLSYSNDVSFAAFARHLRGLVHKRIDARDPKARYAIRHGPDPVNAMLCDHVHLAPFRFGPDVTWPHGIAIANHAKLWMVDDRLFYVGSDNVYPVNLQEFGYIVDDRTAAAELLDAYWNPLWEWSRRAALSGDGVERCIFRDP
jgi:phosphatidylserine/phosphatidylglycerophosphate/cardiolipin synthase-like enzyme